MTEPGSTKVDSLQQDNENSMDFSGEYSANLPAILEELKVSIVLTSYQSSSVLVLSAKKEKIAINLKRMPRPMGIYCDDQRLTLGTGSQVLEFKRSEALLSQVKTGTLDNINQMSRKTMEQDKERFEQWRLERAEQIERVKQSDALYVPRAALTTGMINIHDIAWGTEGLWVVNSTFSCLCTLSSDSSFVVRWKPPFIQELAPEDRCHLNGMAMENGVPRYVTTFNRSNLKQSWSSSENFEGTLIDVKHNEILLNDLVLPHSPRIHGGHVYFCNSGHGTICRYAPENGAVETLLNLPGFTRGIYFMGDLMLVCTSKIRKSENGPAVPLLNTVSEQNSQCGVWLFDLNSMEKLGYFSFLGDVEQIYDIACVPNSTAPEILQQDDALVSQLFEYSHEYI